MLDVGHLKLNSPSLCPTLRKSITLYSVPVEFPLPLSHPAEIYHIVSKKSALPADSGNGGDSLPGGGRPIPINSEAPPPKKSTCCGT